MLIVVNKFGQLANRLFMFSHFIAGAVEYKYKLAYLGFQDYQHLFEGTEKSNFEGLEMRLSYTPYSWLDGLIQKTSRVWFRLLGIHRDNSLYRLYNDSDKGTNVNFDISKPSFISDVKNRTVFLYGWLFRDKPIVEKHIDIIRKVFKPVEPHYSNVINHIKKSRIDTDILVGVHIRKGDYAKWKGGKYFYENEVYAKAMRSIKEQLPQDKRITFLICSNEPINMADFEGLTIVTATNQFIEDLYELSLCDYIVGTLSTYSLWASFYGGVPLCHILDKQQPIKLADFKVVTDG